MNHIISTPLSKEILYEIQSTQWFPFSGHEGLKEGVTRASAKELKEALDAVLKVENRPAAIDRLVEVIPFETLQGVAGVDALKEACSLFRKANYFFDQTDKKLTPSVKERLTAVIDIILSSLESLIQGFGGPDWFRLERLMYLMSLFSILTVILLPLIGGASVGLAVGGILLSMVSLSLLLPYIKRRPTSLPRAKNWSEEARTGKLGTAEGRKGCLNEIANTLIASKEFKLNVMLLGETGVGKTETAKAFVYALQRGDYPELQGKEVFYINTAELVPLWESSSNGNIGLTRISEIMGKHREDIILIFDEIHLACQKRENSVLADQMKTLLDKGKDNFPYVIGITTGEEYARDICQNQPAFARRFKQIAIQNTTREETLEIINNTLLKSAPKVLLAPHIAETLLQKVQEAFGSEAVQPATALRILAQCVKKTAETEKSALEKQVEQQRAKISLLDSQGALGLILSEGEQELETQLVHLEAELAKQKEEMDALHHMRDRLAKAKAEMFRAVCKVSKAAERALPSKELSRFLLLRHFLMPALESKIREEAERLKVRASIDEELIDEVIQKEHENREKVTKLQRK
jgi:ATP-dependent Clp protease ATP-binding subunit ClpA